MATTPEDESHDHQGEQAQGKARQYGQKNQGVHGPALNAFFQDAPLQDDIEHGHFDNPTQFSGKKRLPDGIRAQADFSMQRCRLPLNGSDKPEADHQEKAKNQDEKSADENGVIQ